MTPWAPEDNRISILLSCALDYSSWKGEPGLDEAIEDILQETGIDSNLFNELREWWFFSENPYLEVIEASLLGFANERGDGEDVAETLSEQMSNDVFCSDLLIMIGTRFFHSHQNEPGVPGFDGKLYLAYFSEVNDVEEDDIADFLLAYFETDAVDKVSKEFFESPKARRILRKIQAG